MFLRNIASRKSVMVARTIQLPEVAALGTLVLLKVSEVCTVLIQDVMNIFAGYARMRVVPELMVKGDSPFLILQTQFLLNSVIVLAASKPHMGENKKDFWVEEKENGQKCRTSNCKTFLGTKKVDKLRIFFYPPP